MNDPNPFTMQRRQQAIDAASIDLHTKQSCHVFVLLVDPQTGLVQHTGTLPPHTAAVLLAQLVAHLIDTTAQRTQDIDRRKLSQVPTRCMQCDGRGRLVDDKACPFCAGKGTL